MLVGDLSQFQVTHLSVPFSTVLDRNKDLRTVGLLSKNGRGPRSGARMTSRDAVAVFLMNAVDPTGGRVEAVRRAMALQLCNVSSQQDVRSFGDMHFFNARAAGDALVGLLDDVRSGRWDAWRDGETLEVGFSLDCAADSLHAHISFPEREGQFFRYVSLTYGPNYKGTNKKPVARFVSLSLPWFIEMAKALGPLPAH